MRRGAIMRAGDGDPLRGDRVRRKMGEAQYVDVAKIPELLRLAQEVQRTRQVRILTRDREELALLGPVKGLKQPARPRARRTGPDDPYWGLVGLASSRGPTDVSADKYRYLAEAYAPEMP
jgi:hypothetical protein